MNEVRCTHRGKTERCQSPEYILKYISKNTISNEHPVLKRSSCMFTAYCQWRHFPEEGPSWETSIILIRRNEDPISEMTGSFRVYIDHLIIILFLILSFPITLLTNDNDKMDSLSFGFNKPAFQTSSRAWKSPFTASVRRCNFNLFVGRIFWTMPAPHSSKAHRQSGL